MTSPTQRRLHRRTFLRLAGLSTLLAACGRPTVLPTPTPTSTATPTPRPTDTPIPTPTRTPSPTPTHTPTPTPTPTHTPTPTSTPTPTPSPTATRGPLRVISLIHGPYRALLVDDVLRRFGIAPVTIRVDLGEAVPDLLPFDAIVFAGGEYGPEEFEEPIFQAEKARILPAIEANCPILGICLGNQLIAHWLGGEVKPGRWEVGWLPVQVNELGLADPLLAGLGSSFYAFLWHGDQITRLPDGADLLASTDGCPVQAFRLRGKPVWGLQFNPQYDPVIAEGVIRSAPSLPRYGYNVEEMVATGYREYDDLAGRIFESFLRQAGME